MIRFERSTNYELIASILTNSASYRRMTDDTAPCVEDFFVGPVEGFFMAVAFDEVSPVGMFMVGGNKYAPGIAECHFCFIPQAWGRTGKIAEAFLSWIWQETSIYKLIGLVPTHNRLALRLVKAVGFRQFGVQPCAGTRNGVDFDLIQMEINKPAKGAAA